MRTPFGSEKNPELDAAIARVMREMAEYGPDSKEYPKLIRSLERLTKLKREERRQKASPDTMLIVGGNLMGILIIVAYEHAHVVVSKGLAMLLKTRR